VRSVNYATSPLLASKTPPWRSRFIVAMVGLAFLGLVGRAIYIQIIGTDFYQKEGEKRFAHTLEVRPAAAACSTATAWCWPPACRSPSLWAIPKDFQADTAQRRQLARLLGMPAAELEERLGARRTSPGWRARSTSRCGTRSRR
jgi:cell division protein FtsI (penicillin-binding protein 3)